MTNSKHDSSGTFKIKVVTVSDTRTLENDESGKIIEEKLKEKGHEVERKVVEDDKKQIAGALKQCSYEALIYCGGTGISKRDVTVETLSPLFDKKLPGFGEYFRKKSFEEIGSKAMLSRATAGITGQTPIFIIPGSTNASELGSKIISREIGHIINHAKRP
ncbi:molybdenum cofactor biosynthesis protein B [Methanonatronarchaeum sp. AMET6-2]|uniref:MogA/MoaB family molybdenum cofactor biosynthesis protein n=1 Tax=Methanonatronarchaeum sp. AMET6-2 TaxID=2933293 RepID=UPI00120CEA93|nr:MogA/MoaB family molybdenum cofactor biosynthesis protein [Methanonatronarchaeum sp. AMET6-2]RZN62967.1 MAG: MogA/MoaB family molybdenum cofactor biosynthesis protein [Methanonatronarchaeia archaeon]UOY10734.1 MogA/MoaB family molybdenum cofactor biosynthesis protein [Methanonatronarchaeum sp. AMET6-2]